MYRVDPQFTAGDVLAIFHHDELNLFLGAAFVTVGIVSAAFSLLRRRVDPLLIWLALFSVFYGTRLWVETRLLLLMVPNSQFFRDIQSAINYLVPIPAFFFFEAAGLLDRWGKPVAYCVTVLFLGLVAGTFLFGPLPVFSQINNGVVITALILLGVLSLTRRKVTRDFVIIRWGILTFAAFALVDNIAGVMHRFLGVEAYGFVIFLGCLGYVAARQTLQREAQLGEIQKELQIAKRIQLSILPSGFPASAHFRVAARYQPMTSVAGDFYDFLVANDRQAGLLIADVSGHGVPAALIASMVKLAATSQRDRANDPAALLAGMNAALCGNTQQQFITAAYVHLNAETQELRYSAAGHPPMLLLRDGEVVDVIENGLILAAFDFSTYSNTYLPLEPGDRLVLYTDGVIEAANGKLEEFGQERLRTLLRTNTGRSAAETADLILSTVQRWAVSQEDDLTVLVCDYA